MKRPDELFCPHATPAILLTLALLAGCATPQRRAEPVALLPEVKEALARADTSKPPAPKVPDRVARDLLPPLELNAPVLSQKQVEPRFEIGRASCRERV